MALALACVVACLVAYGPLVVEFFGWQWSRTHYQFFPFVIAACAGLLAYRWREAAPPQQSSGGWLTPAFAIASWLVLLLAVVLYSPLLSAISLVLLAGAGCNELAQRRQIIYLWGIWALLWLVIPLPLGLDRRLISFLQLASSWLSSAALDAVGVLHLMEGNTLTLSGGDAGAKQLFVDEACSGIVSLLSIVACAAIVGVWWNRTPLHVVLLAITGIGWATLLNVLRISLIALVYAWYGLDWSEGTPHETLSLVLFAVTFGALVATDQLLLAWITPVGDRYEQQAGHEVVFGKWLVRAWDAAVVEVEEPPLSGQQRGKSSQAATNLADGQRHKRSARLSAGKTLLWLGVVGFLLLGATQVWLRPENLLEQVTLTADERTAPRVERALQLDGSILPTEVAGASLQQERLEERDTKHFFGQYSKVFEYGGEAAPPALVSCDFAFPGGWHELTVCYKAVGWELQRRAVFDSQDEAGQPWRLVEAEFKKPNGQYGAIFFCEFGMGGEPLEPPAQSLKEGIANALRRRQSTKADLGDVFQVQVMLSSPVEFSEARLAEGRAALEQVRERFRSAIVDDSPNKM